MEQRSDLIRRRSGVRGHASRGGLLLIGVLLVSGVALIALAFVLRGGSKHAPEQVRARPAQAVADDALDVLEAARVYVGEQELGKAAAVLRSAIERAPGDVRLRRALAEVLLQKEDREGALEQYAWLVEQGIESGEGAASDAFAAGSLSAVLGDPGQASAYHSRAAQLDPGNADYPLHHARALIELGRTEDAKVSLARAAVLDEGRGIVWGMLGELAFRENKLEMAAQHVSRARRLEPSAVAWRVLEARVLKRQGEPERALLLLQGLTGADRNQGPVLKAMGECLGMLDRADDALAIYEVAIESVPGEPEFRYEAALWAERLGRTARAIELAREARMMGESRADALIDRLGG